MLGERFVDATLMPPRLVLVGKLRSITARHLCLLWELIKALFTSLVFSPLKDVGICEDLVFTQYSQIPSNTLPQKYSTMMESSNLTKNTLVWRGFVGIFRDYPSKPGLVNNLLGKFWDTG
jgi:hypothetical protein